MSGLIMIDFFFFGHKLKTLPLTLKDQECHSRNLYLPFVRLHSDVLQVRAGNSVAQYIKSMNILPLLCTTSSSICQRKMHVSLPERRSAIKYYLLTQQSSVTHPMKFPIDRFLRNTSFYSLV